MRGNGRHNGEGWIEGGEGGWRRVEEHFKLNLESHHAKTGHT